MDGGRRDGGGGGGDPEVEDEFACAGMLRGSLANLHATVERIFAVSFGIGADELPADNGQMWLKLRGPRKNVPAAKLFVKGLVNQEQQQEVSYPGVLHCVFCGARGLFMDCLIKNTSAHIVVGSPGCLLISGLTEPVVRAYSLITDLVERYEGTQGRRTEIADNATGESLDSRRTFNSLVEKWEDRHTLDLLVLPGAVKESLMDLVKESGLGSSMGPGDLAAETADHRDRESQGIRRRLVEGIPGTTLGGESTGRWDAPSSTTRTLLGHSSNKQDPDVHQRNKDLHGNSPQQVLFNSQPLSGSENRGIIECLGTDMAPSDPFVPSYFASVSTRGRAEGAEERRVRSPQEVGEEGRPDEAATLELEEDTEEGELLLSVGSKKEFGLLLKFFTAMGYTEGVVRRVLSRTGPKEASQILDLVQQEQDRSDRGRKNLDRNKPRQTDRGQDYHERNLPSETEHREGQEMRGTGRGANMEGSNGGMVQEAGNTIGQEQKGQRGGETERLSRGGERNTVPDLEAEGSAVESGGRGKGRLSIRDIGEGENEEDFVLGVLKRAAASCGYTEEKVTEVYSMLPDLSTHQLILELQREGAREAETHRSDSGREGPREVDDVELGREGTRGGAAEEERGSDAHSLPFTLSEHRLERKSLKEKRKENDKGRVEVPNLTAPFVEDVFPLNVKPQRQQLSTDLFTSETNQHQLSQTNTPQNTILPEVRGPPLPTYPPTLHPQITNLHSSEQNIQTAYTSDPSPQFTHMPTQPLPQPNYVANPKPQPVLLPKQLPKFSPPTYITATPAALSPDPACDLSPGKARNRQGFPNTSSGAVVTGEQRFLEGLQAPFKLQLTDEPGDPGLRMIIIDGSNVAMSHGLGHFFSCRGIALAVQHFWNKGHRRINTFLPQWRQKRDPKGKEQHYLTELQKLGLLAYTPSREVQGKRINSYDDRFMLQLAQKTDGVIVTNDNLRDLLDESHVWRDIIKKRLLQYTFVGDHFMVPDDPLGRGGPHLDDFLRSQHRSPDPGSHSFAGVASSFPSSKPPRSKTEVLQFRDRTPAGALESEFGGSWSKGRGQGTGMGQHQRQRGAGGLGPAPGPERSVEETAQLRESLCQVFPGQDSMVTLVLQSHPAETDINSLSYLILEQQLD